MLEFFCKKKMTAKLAIKKSIFFWRYMKSYFRLLKTVQKVPALSRGALVYETLFLWKTRYQRTTLK